MVTDSHGIESRPINPSSALAAPERTPEKIDIFQIRAATTYEHAVGRKKTDRKNACITRVRATRIAVSSDSAKVVGTMKSAKTMKAPRLERNDSSFSMSR